jgi:uracil-DNA glycosylase
LVKCLPLKEGKIRYPSKAEMEDCIPNLITELNHFKPRVVFLLGKQVSDFVLKGKEGSLDSQIISIHHPSYILVYKRKQVEYYLSEIENHIIEHSTDSELVA